VLVTRDKHDEARKLLAGVLEGGVPAEKAQAEYQMARSHYRRDELEPALQRLDRAAAADAEEVNTVRVWRLRGQILEEQKRPAAALTAFQKAYALDRTNEEVQLILIRLAIQTNDELTALEHLRRYTLRNARNVSALVLAAETYYRLRRYDEALDAAMRAREITFHERAQRIIGLVALQRGEYARALDHLDRAEPDAVVIAGLIRSAALAGKPAALDDVLNKAAKLEATTTLKALIEQARRVVERRKVAGDAVASAEYAWRAGLPDRADELLKDAVSAPALAVRARLLLERGRLRDALRDAEAALKASPDEPLALLVRGRIGLERDTPGHLADLEKAVKQTGRADADALSALAEALAAAGRHPDAVKAAKEALALRPKDAALAALLSRLEKGS
jgi:tetratricopeptide (TPR) repeat protein